jgi:hypothetical protein
MTRKRSKKKGRWGLHRIEVEFSTLIAKVKFVFGKKEVPKQLSQSQRRQVRKVVLGELKRFETPSITPVVRYRALPPPASPLRVSNPIGETIVALAQNARTKAIKRGDVEEAILAAIVEQMTSDWLNKQSEQSGIRW